MAISSWSLSHLEATRLTPDERTYVAHWQVIGSTKTELLTDILSGLPGIGTVLNQSGWVDAFATVTGYAGPTLKEAEATRTVWMVRVLYSTKQSQRCNTSLTGSPLTWPAVIRFSTIREQKIAQKDRRGAQIVNTAGDPFDDLFVDDSHQQMTININQAAWDPELIDDFSNTVNNTDFFGLASRMWKFEGATAETRYFGNCVAYWHATYVFTSNRDSWDLKPLNAGFRKRGAAAANKPKWCSDASGASPPPAPVPLNAAGTGELPEADDLIFFDGDPPANLPPFEYYEERDFGLLGIPTSL